MKYIIEVTEAEAEAIGFALMSKRRELVESDESTLVVEPIVARQLADNRSAYRALDSAKQIA